jgi:hypothetical protein
MHVQDREVHLECCFFLQAADNPLTRARFLRTGFGLSVALGSATRNFLNPGFIINRLNLSIP